MRIVRVCFGTSGTLGGCLHLLLVHVSSVLVHRFEEEIGIGDHAIIDGVSHEQPEPGDLRGSDFALHSEHFVVCGHAHVHATIIAWIYMSSIKSIEEECA